MNISHHIYYLNKYAGNDQWRDATVELCQKVMSKILLEPPTEESWMAILELFAAWFNIDDIRRWVAELEPQITRWPWSMRKSILGQQHTRGEKQCVYTLVGSLQISNIDDTSGYKLSQWGQIEFWENLKGISLFKVDCDAEHIAKFLNSRHLQKIHALELKTLDALSGKINILFDEINIPPLQELRLINLCLKLSDFRALCNTFTGKNLALLDISNNFVYDKDLPFLLSSSTYSNLEILDISFTSVGPVGLKSAMSNMQHPKLKKILFKGTQAANLLGVDSVCL